MTNRERLEQFRGRFGIPSNVRSEKKFRIRVVKVLRLTLDSMDGSERVAFENRFALRNGSDVIEGDSFDIEDVVIEHGAVEEVRNAPTFAEFIEGIQQILWTFEELRYFDDPTEKAGVSFVNDLAKAIDISAGIDLRLHVELGRVELMPAGVPALHDLVEDVMQWLTQYPVTNEGASEEDRLTLDNVVEVGLAASLSLAEIAHLERAVPGIGAAVSQWLSEMT